APHEHHRLHLQRDDPVRRRSGRLRRLQRPAEDGRDAGAAQSARPAAEHRRRDPGALSGVPCAGSRGARPGRLRTRGRYTERPFRRTMQALPEYARRRTFAIISHPDAGKTTLTEKLLLFSGAIQIAGSVKARKASRHATSDWMEIEKQRGIS